MEYIAGITDFKVNNSVVTIGKFDGLHLGHQLLMEQVIEYKKQGYRAVMFSFLFHPENLLRKKELELIYTEEEKLHKLRQTGMDVLVSYPFTEETSNLEPEDFIRDILKDKLDARIIVVGKDFRFGHNRSGDIHLLKELECKYDYQLIACDKRKWHHTIISSSAIRKELSEGNMEVANAMLGKPYSIHGKVLHGRKIGRTLGMPTTNLIPTSDKLLPPNGVYASRTLIDGIYHQGVTSIGYKPTVGAEKNKGVETYLFDLDQDLYGKEIEVEILHYQRPELRFDSLEELRVKMQEDILISRNYFRTQK